MVDLIVPFRSRHLYSWKQKGSHLLKTVLPAFVKGLRYDDLEIGDGGGWWGTVEASDIDKSDAINGAKQEEAEMLDLIFSITRLQRRSWTQPQFPKPHMIHACCGVYKYTLACYSAVASEDEKLYRAVGNFICSTAAGPQHVDFA